MAWYRSGVTTGTIYLNWKSILFFSENSAHVNPLKHERDWQLKIVISNMTHILYKFLFKANKKLTAFNYYCQWGAFDGLGDIKWRHQ